MLNLDQYRASDAEQKRIKSLLGLISEKGETALDIGARDGYIAILLTDYFKTVMALDLEQPEIDHKNVIAVKGNARALPFPDNSFDLVLCAEVLEHIPTADLPAVCSELQRVTRKQVIIGVPYKQDIRIGRTTCRNCGGKNPPWGHVNSFDESRIKKLFPYMVCQHTEYIGENRSRTNALSTLLFDASGNPFGTYSQGETCIHCHATIVPPPDRTLPQKCLTRLAHIINSAQSRFVQPHPNWIHVSFCKSELAPEADVRQGDYDNSSCKSNKIA